MGIKEKQTKRQKLYKKKKQTKRFNSNRKKRGKKKKTNQPKFELELPAFQVIFWSTEPQKKTQWIMSKTFKAYFSGTLPVNAVESWSSGMHYA